MTRDSDNPFPIDSNEALRLRVSELGVECGRLKLRRRLEMQTAAGESVPAIVPVAMSLRPRRSVYERFPRYIGEGFDNSRLDTLFLALPISWRGTLQQYVGRLHRLRTGKTEVRVYDYIDGAVPMLSPMFDRRRRGYEAVSYTILDS